jgi:hypothetical protein
MPFLNPYKLGLHSQFWNGRKSRHFKIGSLEAILEFSMIQFNLKFDELF